MQNGDLWRGGQLSARQKWQHAGLESLFTLRDERYLETLIPLGRLMNDSNVRTSRQAIHRLVRRWSRRETLRDVAFFFVHDGYERALKGIEDEARAEVESKYADEWNAAGIRTRLKMLKEIDRETANLVFERARHLSPEDLY